MEGILIASFRWNVHIHLRQGSFKVKIKGNLISFRIPWEEEPQEISVDQFAGCFLFFLWYTWTSLLI